MQATPRARLKREIGAAMVEECGIELGDVGVSSLMLAMAGATLARPMIRETAVKSSLANIARNILVTVRHSAVCRPDRPGRGTKSIPLVLGMPR